MSIGTRIGGKYRLVRHLGAGQMGVVWEAINELTQKETGAGQIGAATYQNHSVATVKHDQLS